MKVIAMDSTEVDTAAGGAAVGIAGATGTIVVTYLKKTVEAILNGTVYAPGGVDVLAVSDNNIFLLTTSLAGGLAGGAGSASVLYTENTVTSQLGGTIEAGTAAVNVKPSTGSTLLLERHLSLAAQPQWAAQEQASSSRAIPRRKCWMVHPLPQVL